jgi:hypothetical protein
MGSMADADPADGEAIIAPHDLGTAEPGRQEQADPHQ